MVFHKIGLTNRRNKLIFAMNGFIIIAFYPHIYPESLCRLQG